MIRKLVLLTITIVLLLCAKVEASQIPESRVKETIVKHSLEMGIDPALALSIAKSESGFRHETKSHYGAVGVFQLLPSTAKRLGVNPYYLSENIKGGLMYYQMMYKMFGSTELALAAYNAGPGNVKRYNNTVPPYSETKRFVSSIMTEYNKQKQNPDIAIINVKNAQKVAAEKAAAQKAQAAQAALAAQKAAEEAKKLSTVVPVLHQEPVVTNQIVVPAVTQVESDAVKPAVQGAQKDIIIELDKTDNAAELI